MGGQVSLGASLFVFSPVEQAALARILRDFPGAAQTLEAGLRPLVDRLVRECRGVLRSEAEADSVLAGLADRIAGRTATLCERGTTSRPSRHSPSTS
jgi:hypothetical protein